MVRAVMAVAIAALLGAAAQDPPPKPPEPKPPAEEYKDRVAKLNQTLAEEHFKIGEYLSAASMNQWARLEFRKAIGFSPDHEGARKRLGFVKKDGEWEPDPGAVLETENRKRGEEEQKVRTEYEKRAEKMGKAVSRLFGDLGGFCERNQMKAEAEAAWRKSVEYDPMNADSRKKLGYVRQGKDGPYLSKFEAAFRKLVKDGLSKAPTGQPHKEETDVERDLGWKHTKRASAHFLVEVPGKEQDWLKEEIRYGEHAYAMFHKLFELKDDLWTQPLDVVFVKDRPAHEQYVDKYFQGDATRREWIKGKTSGLNGFPRTETILGANSNMHDYMVHHTAQHLSTHLVGGNRVWLEEGTAYHFTVLMLGTALSSCLSLGGTGSEGPKRDYQKAEDWRLILKTLVREGKDPEMLAVFKCKQFAELDGAEAVKAWSMVEFLVTEHREKFMEFMSKLRGQPVEDDEKALLQVFGWSLEDFNNRWRAHVTATY